MPKIPTGKLASMHISYSFFLYMLGMNIIFPSWPYLLRLVFTIFIILLSVSGSLWYFKKRGYVIEEKQKFLRLSTIWFFLISFGVSVMYTILIIWIMRTGTNATDLVKAFAIFLVSSGITTLLFFWFTKKLIPRIESGKSLLNWKK
jgi:heme/copper-type cytochrome/quinol oxidase subunit 4